MATVTGWGSTTEPGKSCASSALIAAETASLGGVSGGVMNSGVVFGVGGMTSAGCIKKPGAEEALEGTELWIGPTPGGAAATAAAVVWCNLASSLAFCCIQRKSSPLNYFVTAQKGSNYHLEHNKENEVQF